MTGETINICTWLKHTNNTYIQLAKETQTYLCTSILHLYIYNLSEEISHSSPLLTFINMAT